jgi:hypothetical protein
LILDNCRNSDINSPVLKINSMHHLVSEIYLKVGTNKNSSLQIDHEMQRSSLKYFTTTILSWVLPSLLIFLTVYLLI